MTATFATISFKKGVGLLRVSLILRDYGNLRLNFILEQLTYVIHYPCMISYVG